MMTHSLEIGHDPLHCRIVSPGGGWSPWALRQSIALEENDGRILFPVPRYNLHKEVPQHGKF